MVGALACAVCFSTPIVLANRVATITPAIAALPRIVMDVHISSYLRIGAVCSRSQQAHQGRYRVRHQLSRQGEDATEQEGIPWLTFPSSFPSHEDDCMQCNALRAEA